MRALTWSIFLARLSLAILSEADRRTAIGVLRSLAVPIAFDPNVRASLWPSMAVARETFEAVAALARYLLPSREDLHQLYGPLEAADEMTLLRNLTGAEIALTADVQGCRLWFGESDFLPAPLAKVVIDTSGAGDSFNGAYLAARLEGRSPHDAAREGLDLAAWVVGQRGAIVSRRPFDIGEETANS